MEIGAMRINKRLVLGFQYAIIDGIWIESSNPLKKLKWIQPELPKCDITINILRTVSKLGSN